MAQRFDKILQQAQEEWMNIEGVLSVAQGKKGQQDCIDVYITGNSESVKKKIPSEYQKLPVVFRESGGPFQPQK